MPPEWQTFDAPLIGQSCIWAESAGRRVLGTVADYNNRWPNLWIRVRHPLTGVDTDLAPENVWLVSVAKDFTRNAHWRALESKARKRRQELDAAKGA